MPKERPCLGELSPRVTSSKNAKDKSNSTTLLAIRNAEDADNSSGRGSRCSSEKDSGFSDGSDWQQTDVEDRWSNKRPSSTGEHPDNSQPGHNQELGQRNLGNLIPAGRNHSLYILNDMVLNQQPVLIQKRGQLHWRNRISQSNSSGSPNVILLQHPGLMPVSLQPHKSSSQRSNTTGKKINGAFLPILNSYPRIAPHPSKKLPDKSTLNSESQNVNKRGCSEHKSDDTPVSRGPQDQHLLKQPKLAVSTSGSPCSSSTRDHPSSSNSTTASTSHDSPTSSSVHTTRGLHKNTATSARYRRFFNTVEILRQSGLLDITLRTKELMRQSNATERDIAQLRQHTELLCQAASDPSRSLNGVPALEHLHRAMHESDSYPNLNILQDSQVPSSHPDSAGQPESIPTGDANRLQAADSSEASPSCLLAPVPDQNDADSEPRRELNAEEKSSDGITFTPPDSSTG